MLRGDHIVHELAVLQVPSPAGLAHESAPTRASPAPRPRAHRAEPYPQRRRRPDIERALEYRAERCRLGPERSLLLRGVDLGTAHRGIQLALGQIQRPADEGDAMTPGRHRNTPIRSRGAAIAGCRITALQRHRNRMDRQRLPTMAPPLIDALVYNRNPPYSAYSWIWSTHTAFESKSMPSSTSFSNEHESVREGSHARAVKQAFQPIAHGHQLKELRRFSGEALQTRPNGSADMSRLLRHWRSVHRDTGKRPTRNQECSWIRAGFGRLEQALAALS
ncbi:hypothetical protein EDC29_11174 [Marichromatium gracile]|uniref:Uncharacterized protein n=1 Tax=Marichromatium gracile TaxID=1048 RepID=A0A4R4A7B7_MARGR|nr:hypothetical protein EDC29_11174 [Marichromatium gracile]